MLDDMRVMLDVGGSGNVIDQLGEIARAADRLQLPPTAKLVDQRHEIAGLVTLVQLDPRLVDRAMAFPMKIRGLEEGGDLADRFGIDQQGTQHRPLRFQIGR